MASQVHQCSTATQSANHSQEGTPVDVFELAARLVGYSNGTRYRVRGQHLFAGVPLQGTRVLEVGCGRGAWAIWAALHGAEKAVGIEPEAEGSTRGTFEAFGDNVARLGLQQKVEGHRTSLQAFSPPTQIDVVVMYNVINHLDEDAVVMLHRDENMVRRYVDILRGVRAMMSDRGSVIVADCGRSNLWARLGMKSPFAPTIEWTKHQNPRVWIRIFQAAGFRPIASRWSPMYPLGKFSTNWPMQFITISHFVLTFGKL